MRVLVCGSRNYDPLKVEDYLDEFFRYRAKPELIVEGGASGADSGGNHWGRREGIQVQTFPADWNGYGKRAGPIRNHQMLKEGKPDLVIAFLAPESRGTRHMIEISQKAGIPVEIINI